MNRLEEKSCKEWIEDVELLFELYNTSKRLHSGRFARASDENMSALFALALIDGTALRGALTSIDGDCRRIETLLWKLSHYIRDLTGDI